MSPGRGVCSPDWALNHTELRKAAVSPSVFFRPKTLSCKGKEMENVFNIRTPEDANRVVKLATSKNVVIVGASFLGMEVAAYLAERAHSVSLVELEHVPFKKFFGERVGRAVMKMFENNRVKFYMQTEVSELREQEGKLKEVVLKSGKVLRADVCVVGIGKGCVGAEPGREGKAEVGGDMAEGGRWDWVARATGSGLPALPDYHT